MSVLEQANLDNYYCKKCGNEVYPQDGFWACDCYQIGAHELDIGYHEIPRFWVKDYCVGCREEIHKPYGAVVHFLGEITHLCVECARDGNKDD